MHQFFVWFCVRRESHIHRVWIHSLCLTNTLWIAETFKSWLTMESTVTTFTNTTKWKWSIQHLAYRIIDYISTWTCTALNFFNNFWILRKMIYNQRFISWVYFFNNLIKIAVSKNWQNRTKDFFLHHSWCFFRFPNNRWWNKSFTFIDFTSKNNFSFMIIFNKFLQSLDMELIDDLSIVSLIN